MPNFDTFEKLSPLSNSLFSSRNRRFIPSSSSSQVYRFSSHSSAASSPHQSTVDLSLQDDYMVLRPSSLASGSSPDTSVESVSSITAGKITSPHEDLIAQALGMNSSRVLEYTHLQHQKKEVVNNEELQMPTVALESDKSINSTRNLKNAAVLDTSSILQAPGLKNDFYYNLVSWSERTGKITVGLGTAAYTWSTNKKVECINLHNHFLPIVCVSSSAHQYSIITFGNGDVTLIDQLKQQVVTKFNNNRATVHVVTWINSNSFLLGDEIGVVVLYKITSNEVIKVCELKCHRHQICGIAINKDRTQITIGGNDNCCSVWDIHDLQPKLRFILPHSAAVKAISYCPWAPSLVATGGGTKDRNIRFWHAGSGTLLATHFTNGQVTSLTWSTTRKEIAATFGFGDHDHPILLAVYSYPKMKPVKVVPASLNLRILSASGINGELCVGANDSTVRIYEVWPDDADHAAARDHSVASSAAVVPFRQVTGSYGSPLIDLREGIARGAEVIR